MLVTKDINFCPQNEPKNTKTFAEKVVNSIYKETFPCKHFIRYKYSQHVFFRLSSSPVGHTFVYCRQKEIAICGHFFQSQ